MKNTQYLESKVLTAPAHRLHLILIEGAIRFGRQAEDALRRGERDAASSPLLRAIDIVGEMLTGVRQQKGDVNKRLAELYWFLFRRLTEAKIHGDAVPLAEALKLLEYERETWLLVCDKLANEPVRAAQSSPKSPTSDSRLGDLHGSSLPASGGFSLEV
jgi:flagellar protein FliS